MSCNALKTNSSNSTNTLPSSKTSVRNSQLPRPGKWNRLAKASKPSSVVCSPLWPSVTTIYRIASALSVKSSARLAQKSRTCAVSSRIDKNFLDVRDDQLREALGQVAALQQRVGELEATHQQATIGALESERTRAVLESEIASLRHEVTVRERALTERQEAVTAVELALHGRIQALQQELAGSRSAIEARESELDQLRGESDSRRARVTALESAADIEMAARHALESERAKLESELTNLNEVLAGKKRCYAPQRSLCARIKSNLPAKLPGWDAR